MNDDFEMLLCRFEKAVERLESICGSQKTPVPKQWKPGMSGNPYSAAYLSEQQKQDSQEKIQYLTAIYNSRKDLFMKGVLTEAMPDEPQTSIKRLTNEAKLRVLKMFSEYGKAEIKKAMIAFSDATLLGKWDSKNLIDDFVGMNDGKFIILERFLKIFKQQYVTDDNTGLVADKEAIDNRWYKKMFSM